MKDGHMESDKIVCNNRDSILRENLESLCLLQKGSFKAWAENSSYLLCRNVELENRVKIIVSGGANAGPLFSEFVGPGLADGMAHGEFNCAPAAFSIFELGKIVSSGQGILLLANNFTGDFLNNDMAAELLNDEGIAAKAIYCSDDILSARGEPRSERGGLCGIVFLIKIAAEMAKSGFSLNDIYRMLSDVNDRLHSITVTISDDHEDVFYGEGFSGEKAPYSEKMSTVDGFVNTAIRMVLEDVPAKYRNAGSGCYVCVNRFRQLSSLEGNLIVRSVYNALERNQLNCGGITVSHIFDTFDRKGCNISFLFVDDRIKGFLKPVQGYNFTV